MQQKTIIRLGLILPRIDQRDYFINLFAVKYTVLLDNTNPHVLIYDAYNSKNKMPTWCRRGTIYVAYTEEPEELDYTQFHLALGFDEDRSESIYLPYWVPCIDWFNTCTRCSAQCSLPDILVRTPVTTSTTREFFCGFVATNVVKMRGDFVELLSKEYKTVTCPGEAHNNHPKIGGRMGPEKQTFLRKCKFTLAFENCSKPGYVTEKILHAFQARTVPIYWGSPHCGQVL